MVPTRNFRFSIDRGGTFTDVYAETPDELGYRRIKLLSVDPANYPDAPREGIRRVLEEVTGISHPRDKPVDTSRIEWIRMGTTVATNALLEREGARTALLITQGFRDLLHIGNQARPDIFDLSVSCPGVLYERVIEVDERVRPESEFAPSPAGVTKVKGITGETVLVERAPDLDTVNAQLLEAKASGIDSVAIVLMHSYTFTEHEDAIADVARRIGFRMVSTSSGCLPMVKIVSRGYTATADAYLTPHIREYLTSFQSGFDEGIKCVPVSFMQSDGGLARAEKFSGFRAILSGPAGGYIGYAKTAYDEGGDRRPVVGFDMGGTSTDVSRFAGNVEQVFEARIAGVTIQAPQLDIHTVAAGGGSRFFFRDGLFVVGPESARAHPGPVCYRKGGYLATTDGNLMLGRVRPEFFPAIFGPGENERLDLEGTQAAFARLTREEVNTFYAREGAKTGSASAKVLTPEEVAYGFIKVANEAMCRPIREITQMRGYDITTHVLACFGGAGGQHACAIARNLGMRTVFVHRFASILSAYGIGLANVVHEVQEPAALVLSDSSATATISSRHEVLEERARTALSVEGFEVERISLERFLNLRYDGTDSGIMMAEPQDKRYAAAFEAQYMREFGFTLPGRKVLVDDIRVRGTGLAKGLERLKLPRKGIAPKPVDTKPAYFDNGWVDTPSYALKDLEPGSEVSGPCILLDDISTILVEPGCTASMNDEGNIFIEVPPPGGDDERARKCHRNGVGPEEVPPLDSVQLSIFSHRFMGIAEQMGRTLQRTSVSTNMKERLDFSCAVFDKEGGLVANAPHIPVHLGAMQDAVRAQSTRWGDDVKPGDVFVSNHPQLAGGSHLPDITVITPVFDKDTGDAPKLLFWVASRGHHADIGGITPGSMPPFSKLLAEEGAQIIGFKLVKDGVFQDEGIKQILAESRNLEDNLNDLRAQVAANNMGIKQLRDLIRETSEVIVSTYMGYIQGNAEASVRTMLKSFCSKRGLEKGSSVTAEDQLDDGSPIKLTVTLDPDEGSAIFDFEGTGPELYGNLNAPPPVVYSAVVYSLRCLCGTDIPLNQGCLKPVTIRIPDSCLLNPSSEAAVVGGNVQTSQRVVDVVLRAFQACAASQGCMNNLTFGNRRFGYYETIAGGAGAGPTWDGRSGVHTHMTNTRITDPEILERRYPVKLHEFSLRPGSGGDGAHRGGDGVVRDIEFLEDMEVSILSERRAAGPYGMAGGSPGAKGVNLFIQPDGRIVSLGGKTTFSCPPGGRFRLLSPGGGGYGAPGTALASKDVSEAHLQLKGTAANRTWQEGDA